MCVQADENSVLRKSQSSRVRRLIFAFVILVAVMLLTTGIGFIFGREAAYLFFFVVVALAVMGARARYWTMRRIRR